MVIQGDYDSEYKKKKRIIGFGSEQRFIPKNHSQQTQVNSLLAILQNYPADYDFQV